jgi:hypothetical protein
LVGYSTPSFYLSICRKRRFGEASTALIKALPNQPQTTRACVVILAFYPTVRTSTMHADETLM